MFLDTTFNSLSTVLSTIYQNFVEAAMKYYRYAKCMPTKQQPRASLLIGESLLLAICALNPHVGFKRSIPTTTKSPKPSHADTIRDLTSLATTLIKAPPKSGNSYACSVNKRQIQW